MSAMQAELKRVREIYDPRRDSTDIFAKQYGLPTIAEKEAAERASMNENNRVSNGRRGSLPPYNINTPTKPTHVHVKAPSRQPEMGSTHIIEYSEEERRLHFDPTYRSHRRLIRTGHAATIIFAICFVLAASAFSVNFIGRQYTAFPMKITQTALVGVGLIMYIIRALVNWQVKKFIGRMLRAEKRWSCENGHDLCDRQRYTLYGGKKLEVVYASLWVMMAALCCISWTVKF